MSRSLVPGIVLVLGGLLIALLPTHLLPVCDALVTTASGAPLPGYGGDGD